MCTTCSGMRFSRRSPLKKKADEQQDHIEIEAFMMQVVRAEKGEESDKLPAVPDGLNLDVDYVIETWLQHRTHHTYPRAGGYDDQDALLMEDWKKINLWHIRVSRGVVVYDPNAAEMEFPPVRNWIHD
jgi:hypothetical protein